MVDLVLTGYEPFFPDENYRENAVYLANFCFLNNPNVKFEEYRKYKFLDSPYKSWNDVEIAYRYTDLLYDKILPSVCRTMNEVFKVDKSEKYWSIVLIRYIYSFIHIYYDRYLRLCELKKQSYAKFEIKILNYSEMFISKENDFFDLSVNSHYYNLNLLSDFIRKNNFGNEVLVFDIKTPFERKQAIDFFWEKNKQRTKDVIKSLYFKLLKYRYNKVNSIRMGLIYGLSEKQKIELLPRVKSSLPLQSGSDLLIETIYADTKLFSTRVLNFEVQSEFEEILSENFFRYIPEEFKVLKIVKKNPYKIWLGMDVYNSNRFLLADTLEKGGTWYSVQHGGGYGQIGNFPLGKIEYSLPDGFISWGWKYDHSGYKGNIYPLSSPSLSKLGTHCRKNNEILIITHTYFVYSVRLQSIMLPEMVLDYTNNLIDFCNYIKKNDSYKYKVKTTNMSWANRDYLQDNLPDEIELLSSDNFNIVKKMKISALCVVDHMSTTYIQSLAMNVPTLLFWNSKHFKECSNFSKCLNLLREVGILFDDPFSAARKLNEILETGIENWWFDKKIQAARQEFLWNHGRTSSEWKSEWKLFLENLLFDKNSI
ncbi:LIC12162 family transferase [Leptospira weilii]|uniref:Putative transferase, LIC12162 family n=1 Tax=Leptospira weilii str. UI 13098 TaxID=1088542 RepID=M6Q6T4_9LEPT|nr:LIC12162 family protein [Leptospira weilii]EMN88890.1 putative transferase, LIC12162 family [Leptospira weilii str. UI 13098]